MTLFLFEKALELSFEDKSSKLKEGIISKSLEDYIPNEK